MSGNEFEIELSISQKIAVVGNQLATNVKQGKGGIEQVEKAFSGILNWWKDRRPENAKILRLRLILGNSEDPLKAETSLRDFVDIINEMRSYLDKGISNLRKEELLAELFSPPMENIHGYLLEHNLLPVNY